MTVRSASCSEAAGPRLLTSHHTTSNPGATRVQRGVDALRAHGLRMLGQPPSEWPHLIICLGDQIYADDPSPKAQRRMTPASPRPRGGARRHRRRLRGVHAWLYLETWTPDGRAVAAVRRAVDDDLRRPRHDRRLEHLRSWVDDIRAEPWWREHIIGGLVSYWIYQHLGNLDPDRIKEEGMLAELLSQDDGEPVLRRWAERVRGVHAGARRVPLQLHAGARGERRWSSSTAGTDGSSSRARAG